jgi:hypothetical protein
MTDNPFLNIFTDVVGSSGNGSKANSRIVFSGSNSNNNNKNKKKNKKVVERDVVPRININSNRVFSIFSAQRPSQPPIAPKPTYSGSSSILATNRLKNRLIVGWYAAKGGDDNVTSSSSSRDQHQAITKGFGEGRFEMSDSIGDLDSMSMNSGLWPNLDTSTFTMDGDGEDSSIAEKSFVYRAESSDLVSRRSVMIPRAESSYIEPTRKQRVNTSMVTSTLASLTAAPAINTRVSDLNNAQVSVASTYQSSGWIGVASSIANGDTEFCYIKSDDTDHYNFSLLETAPPQSLLSNDYTTLSKRGILRALPNGDSEFIDYPTLLMHEQVYHKIKQIPVFGKYHVWKMFYVWKTNVHYNAFLRKVMMMIVMIMI